MLPVINKFLMNHLCCAESNVFPHLLICCNLASQAQGYQRRPQRPQGQDGPTPLFDDTSTMGGGQPGPGGNFQAQGAYGQPQPVGFPGQQLMNDPMANMAMQYGAGLADHGKEVMEKQVWNSRLVWNRWIAHSVIDCRI